MKYPAHPATDAFPMLSDEELLELARDITGRGLIHPIMLDHAGVQIVDGRNRQRACDMANIEPRYDRLPEGKDEVAYIYSTNIARRHMTKGQQAIALAMLYPEAPGRGKRDDPAKRNVESSDFSIRLLQRARLIIQYPDLTLEVRDGGRTFDSALKEAQQRDDIAASGTAHMHRLRNEAPDLAALVDEERLSLTEAVVTLDGRIAEQERAARQQREAFHEHVLGALRHASVFNTQDGVDVMVTLLADGSFREGLADDGVEVGARADDYDEAAAGLATLTRLLRRSRG